MRLIVGALGDPTPQQFDLNLGELLAPFGRRHPLVGIVARDACDQLAQFRLAGHNRLSAAEVGTCAVGRIESQVGLAVARVGPVTRKALV